MSENNENNEFILTDLAYENNIEDIFLKICLIKDIRDSQVCYIRSSDVICYKGPIRKYTLNHSIPVYTNVRLTRKRYQGDMKCLDC